MVRYLFARLGDSETGLIETMTEPGIATSLNNQGACVLLYGTERFRRSCPHTPRLPYSPRVRTRELILEVDDHCIHKMGL